MGDNIDRLRALLGEGAWEAPASPEESSQDGTAKDPIDYLSTDPEDDEKILSISRVLGGEMDPKNIIGMLFHIHLTSKTVRFISKLTFISLL